VQASLARRIRDEVYHAKTLVRAVRNSTKVTAAALADSEARLDALIDELEESQAKEAQDHDHEEELAQTH
jgi:hypothetical protein